jgi:hypothetical protein
MKYLKSYNESLRDLMTPKSEEEILKSLKGLDNSDLLRKSIENEFIKGIELALQNELTEVDIEFILIELYYTKNKEIVKLLLDKVINELNEDQIYLIEKYILGLHQNEEKDYEIWFKDKLTDLNISKSTIYSNILIYKKDGVTLYNYNDITNWFYINNERIWSVFESNYHINYSEIKLLTKNMVQEHLNLKNITTKNKGISYLFVEGYLILNDNTNKMIYEKNSNK